MLAIWTYVSRLAVELRRIRGSSMARNAGWMVLGQGSGFLLQSIYFILIARLLGPSEYGLYAGAFALTSILGQYSAMGSGTLFLRYVTADRKQFSVYWGNILVTTTVASVLMVAALALLSGRILGLGLAGDHPAGRSGQLLLLSAHRLGGQSLPDLRAVAHHCRADAGK